MCNRISCHGGLVLQVCILVTCIGQVEAVDSFANSIGMQMIRIESGNFLMGQEGKENECDWDEQPVHRVTISKPFYISETEVTLEQFQQFRPDFEGSDEHSPYVASISWYDAKAFCDWLSNKERRPYRLPTEAEWEYACRAGTQTPFSSGKSRPGEGMANPWGLKNMHTGVREWCLDWHGEYPAAYQVDPIGPARGMTKVVRGGGMDNDEARYARSANRASIAPSFAPYPEPKKVQKKPKVEDLSQTKLGLIGMWYGESDFTNAKDPEVLTQFENIESHGNNWAARWHGFIEAPFEKHVIGEVTFEAEADDDDVKLEIEGKTVLSGSNKPSGKTLMWVKGRKYPVVLSYSHSGGPTVLRLYWSWPGQSKVLVPGSALSHSLTDEKKYKAPEDKDRPPGYHSIGFRVVQAPMPTTRPLPYEAPFVQQCVKQDVTQVKKGPNPNGPYFRKRYLLPTPPENVSRETIDAAGLHPSFREHNHSPALEVCPNGDVLMIIYTSYSEYEPGVSLMATRLRFGADQWDMPSWMFDFVDLNDHAPLLWNDKGTIHFFWGSPRFRTGSAYPFQWTSSKDNGATWSQVKFPNFKGPIGCHSKQPINTALRDLQNTMYVASDGCGGKSVLWASRDNGKTWYDTGGRSGGRHTTYVLLKDGRILGMGGKNTDIDGFMPKSISSDGGKTWEVTRTPFPAQGSNQRPSVMRLQSGRLFFAGDFQHISGNRPEGATERGSYVALSEDEGKTWHVKKLIGTQQHEDPDRHNGADTIGYSAARQAPNGLIHLITTMNRPCLHLVFNEAWIFAKHTRYEDMSDAQLMTQAGTIIQKVEKFEKRYPNGSLKATWSGGVADNGRFLLDGPETWYCDNRQKQWEVTYKLGRKVGKETYCAPDGTVKWEWEHHDDGTSLWTQWWSAGKKKAESTWRNHKCDGIATRWDRDGNVISEVEFVDGLPSRG